MFDSMVVPPDWHNAARVSSHPARTSPRLSWLPSAPPLHQGPGWPANGRFVTWHIAKFMIQDGAKEALAEPGHPSWLPKQASQSKASGIHLDHCQPRVSFMMEGSCGSCWSSWNNFPVVEANNHTWSDEKQNILITGESEA